MIRIVHYASSIATLQSDRRVAVHSTRLASLSLTSYLPYIIPTFTVTEHYNEDTVTKRNINAL